MEKNALELTIEDFGSEGVDLSSEIDAIWKRQQVERKKEQLKLIPKPIKNFITAADAEYGRTYTICIVDNGREEYVKADFITKGRGEFVNLVFFRRVSRGGRVTIHGIPEYTVMKEVYFEPRERE